MVSGERRRMAANGESAFSILHTAHTQPAAPSVRPAPAHTSGAGGSIAHLANDGDGISIGRKILISDHSASQTFRLLGAATTHASTLFRHRRHTLHGLLLLLVDVVRDRRRID